MNSNSPQIEALEEFVLTARMVQSYQMLLLLVMLSQAKGGRFSLQTAASRFTRFYQARTRAGLVAEQQHGSKQAAIDARQIESTIKNSPFPRFRDRGFLTLEGDQFEIPPALHRALTAEVRAQVRALAIRRLATYFGEGEAAIDALLQQSIEA